jgi:hypothetical protein
VAAANVLSTLPGPAQQILTSREFFPQLISAPFHHGLTIVFAVAAGLAVLAGAASLLRGGRYQPETGPSDPAGPSRLADRAPQAGSPSPRR